MEKSNLIISIIIVVCIAAGVAAYGLTNNDNVIFSNLAGLDSGDSNNGMNHTNGSGIHVETGSGSGSSVGTGSSGSGSSNSGKGHSGSSGSGGSSGGSGGSSSKYKVSSARAQTIANEHIEVPGAWAGTPKDGHDGFWYVPIYEKTGGVTKQVGTIAVNQITGMTNTG